MPFFTHYVSINTLYGLYFALIHYHLSYGITAWASSALSNLKRIINLKKKALVFNSRNVTVNKKKVLSIEKTYKYFFSVKFFKFYRMRQWPDMLNHMDASRPVRNYGARHNAKNN